MAQNPSNKIYKEEFCERLIEHMGQGMTLMSFGGVVKCGESTLNRWRIEHPEWKEAIEIGKNASLLFYERLKSIGSTGATEIKDKDGNMKTVKPNHHFINFHLARVHHRTYGEKQTITHENDATRLIIDFGGDKKEEEKKKEDDQ